jgi:hypothetical protein
MAAKDEIYQVRDSFAVPGADGVPVAYPVGALVGGNDPLARTHKDYLERVQLEQATAAPGEVRRLRLPSGQPMSEVTKHRRGHAHTTGDAINMAHNLPPEDPRSPASPFAAFQPGAGVVADDVPDEQNQAGGTKAADYSGPSSADEEHLQNVQVAKNEEAGTTAQDASGGLNDPGQDSPAPKTTGKSK